MPYPVTRSDPGVTRQVLAESPELMIVRFTFETGAEGKPHRHSHVQGTYVAAGRFAFLIGSETREIAQDDSLIVASGVVHGCRCLEAGSLIDSFTPRRDDFL